MLRLKGHGVRPGATLAPCERLLHHALETLDRPCRLCRVGMIGRYSGLVAEETGEAFDIVVCPQCGMGRTSPQPADLSPYYPPSYYGNRHGLTAGFCNRRRVNLLGRWMGPGAGRLLLDWGCGDGDFLLAARRRGWVGCGLERHVRASGQDDPPIVQDLDALYGRPPFACTTFWHVLEHLDDPI